MIRRLLSSLTSDFRSLPSGFGTAGIRRQRICGGINIVGDWDGQFGVETDEDGMSISRFVVRYFLFVNSKLLSNVGEPRARAMSDAFSREIEMEGEMTGVDYPSALATAISLNNDTDEFGDGSGDILLDEGTVTQARAEWRTLNIKLSSDPGVEVA